MDLKEISLDIRNILEEKRNEYELTFIEEDHKYFMKDINGNIRDDFKSVSKIMGLYYEHFDSTKKAYEMSNGDDKKAIKLLEDWKLAGNRSTNMGSRVHYHLEDYLISLNGNYKSLRKPIYEIDDEQKLKSDKMIKAGKNFISEMYFRGAVLLDTESVLGSPIEQYTGQPDKIWLMMNRQKTDFGFVITDYKTNQPKNFEIQSYTGKMYYPFNNYPNNALGHYYLQIPLYARLLISMLKGTKFENKNFLGGVIVLLKEDETYSEYRVPKDIIDNVFNLKINFND